MSTRTCPRCGEICYGDIGDQCIGDRCGQDPCSKCREEEPKCGALYSAGRTNPPGPMDVCILPADHEEEELHKGSKLFRIDR